MTNKQAAQAIRAQMKDESAADKRSMSKLAKLIETGKYDDAFKHFRSMDTFVREVIPEDVVHHLHVKKDGGVRKLVAHVRLKECSKVLKEGFRPGVVMQIALEFPKGVTDEQIAMSLVQKSDEIVAQAVEVLYTEGDEEIVTI